MTGKRILAAMGVVLVMGGVAVAVDDDVAAALKTQKTYEKAVVHISAVLNVTAEGPLAQMMGGAKEQKITVVGTVIDPSGLAVTSATSLNPTAAMSGMKLNVGGQEMTLSFKTEIGDVKYRFADGTEVPARIVLKDPELDLAFIAPEKPLDKQTKSKFAVVNLSDAAKKVAVLDKVVTLGRLGKDLNYTSSVQIGRISAVVTKPRTFYVGAAGIGVPVFTAKGKLVGICVTRRKRGAQASRSAMSMASGLSMSPVILPAADVKETAAQAKAEMKKPPKAKAKKEDKSV